MAPGNEFAAPSTASFGDSNEENVEDTTINRQILVPATVTSPEALHVNRSAQATQDESRHSPARNVADMIGNAATSANSTPLSYEVVTMSPVQDEPKTQQEEEMKIPKLPDIQDWRSALQQEPGSQIIVAKGASPRDGEAKTTDLGESGACPSGCKPVRAEQTADEKLDEALLPAKESTRSTVTAADRNDRRKRR